MTILVQPPAPLTIARNVAGVGIVTQWQTGHGWTLLSGTTGDLNATGVGHVAGTQCAWFRGNGDHTIVGCKRVGGASFDLTGKDLGFLVRVDEPNQLLGGSANFVLYVGNTNFANFITFDLSASSSIKYFPRRLTSGTDYGGSWTHITIPVDPTGTNSYTAKTGAQTAAQILANVTDWQVYHRDVASSTPAKISVQEIYTVPKQAKYPNGVCCLTFDDNYLSCITKVAPMLAAVGGRAQAYIIEDQVLVNSNFMSLEQTQALQNTYGWSVGSHSALGADHEAGPGVGMTALSADASIADVQSERQFLRDCGFSGYNHFAYPHGAYCVNADGSGSTNDQVDVTLAPYTRTARTLYSKMPETVPPGDPTKLRTFLSTTNATTLASLKAAADVTKRTQAAMVVVMHQIVDSSASVSTQWLTADLQSFVDYAVSLGMPLLTVAEVFGDGTQPVSNYRNSPNMSYTTGNGRFANVIPITLVTGTIAATASSTGVELGDRNHLRLDIVISAASGTTPTLDVAVQTSPDNATWTTVASFAQQTTTATVHKLFGPIDRFVRVTETITGTTPSFTRTISGEAV